MNHRRSQSLGMVLLLLLLGLLAAPAAALAQAGDVDGYPIDTEPEIIVRDDVVGEREAPPPAVSVPEPEARVMGVALARTGVELVLLAVAGLALVLAGTAAVYRTRGRRAPAGPGGGG
jgi:hypothetical protein